MALLADSQDAFGGPRQSRFPDWAEDTFPGPVDGGGFPLKNSKLWDAGGAVFNVASYNDGVLDDDAFEAAYDAAVAAGGGTIFWLGDLNTETGLVVTDDNIHLAGAGINATRLVCALGVAKGIRFGFKGTGAGTANGVFHNSVSNLMVTRAAGTIPANSVGIAWECFGEGHEMNTWCDRHYYPRSFEGGVDGISIGWRGYYCRASNATRAYAWIKGVAGVTFTVPYFGQNGGEDEDPVYCVEISGGANDINFTDGRFQPTGPNVTRPDVIGFTNYTSATGVFSFVNFCTENVRHMFVSDVGTAVISELKIAGGRWTGAGNFFALHASTLPSNFALSGGAAVSVPFNFSPGSWAKVGQCFFGAPVTLTGRGLTASDCDFRGNICDGDLTVTGAWRKLRGATPEHNTVRGAFADTSTGDTPKSLMTTYVPAVTSGSGTITDHGVNSASYARIGPKLVHLRLDVTIIDVGTAGTDIRISLPVTASGHLQVLAGTEDAVNGSNLKAWIEPDATVLRIKKYDNTFFAANGYRYLISGTYETV